MFYTLGSWNRILHLGSQACGIRVVARADPEGRTRERERGERACETSDGARGCERGRGAQVYMPRDFGPISPVKPNSVRVQESWSSLCSALQFMAVITSIGLELD